MLKKPGISRNIEQSAIAHNISFGDKSEAQDLMASADGQKAGSEFHKPKSFADPVPRHSTLENSIGKVGFESPKVQTKRTINLPVSE